MALVTMVILNGDETGEELLTQALRVVASDVIGMDVEFEFFDLSLANRRATANGVVAEATAALVRVGLGVKAATITPEGADDVRSPNRLLRENGPQQQAAGGHGRQAFRGHAGYASENHTPEGQVTVKAPPLVAVPAGVTFSSSITMVRSVSYTPTGPSIDGGLGTA